ncbi:MAG: magnesium chelatase subunit H [Pseudomonadota bacterium]
MASDTSIITTHTEETPSVRVAVLTLDNHLAGSVARACRSLRKQVPGLTYSYHAAADWEDRPDALEQCKSDIAQAEIVIVTMLFMDQHINAILPTLTARRETCDAMVCALSAGEVIKLTRLGDFSMASSDSGVLAMLKRLRGSKKAASSGAGQLAMLKRLPKILRFIPGKAQDLRTYFIFMQYWLAGAESNVTNLIALLINKYADGERASLRGTLLIDPPRVYPEIGVYHPDLPERLGSEKEHLPSIEGPSGTVGLILMRSYLLAGDTRHYDGVIKALEERGLRTIPVFAHGLDAEPAISKFFEEDGIPTVDAIVSLTGFSLIGGPAYNDSNRAQELLAKLGLPYISAHPLEFQTLQTWAASARGLSPVEATMMVAIPELDGATQPTVFGGRPSNDNVPCEGCERKCSFGGAESYRRMEPCIDRIEQLAERTAKLIRLRAADNQDKKLGVVLFNFPPNAGAVGTAAHLSVFESLWNVLVRLKEEGYTVDLPADLDALKSQILGGNADQYGADANVVANIPVGDHVRRDRWLSAIEQQWGPAPGRQNALGNAIQIMGAEFGNIMVGLQPGFGYEGDPMRLLFDHGSTPTHAFSAFYRYMREDFGADAMLHFGTHGAMEFMPGKQTGAASGCWPDRLTGTTPNFYLYAANNPSEGAIAKRRSSATLISYLTPSMSQSGLYKDIQDLKGMITRWQTTDPAATDERLRIADAIRDLANACEIGRSPHQDTPEFVECLSRDLIEIETTLIPTGLHIVGQTLSANERLDMLRAMADTAPSPLSIATIEALAFGTSSEDALKIERQHNPRASKEQVAALADTASKLMRETELDAIVSALNGRFVPPAPGGDLVTNPQILPTGRNIHGFDPYKLPSRFAVIEGQHQADLLLRRHREDGNPLPETVALVLWGTDNLKSEGAQVAQALSLIGTRPRRDSYGRLCGAELIPLDEMDHPRIDVVATLSGIFRDLLPLQTRMLAEAVLLAAKANEPDTDNYIAKHVRATMARDGIDIETAALRVFSNAEGAYGANVNQMIDASCWTDQDDLADTYEARKSFAYGVDGKPIKQASRLKAALETVDLAYQNLESIELGVTTVDHYMDTLGGIASAVKRARGKDAPVYISDHTQGQGKVRTLSEQVTLETRTRMLNPMWYEGMLKHGHEGVRQIESSVTNTLGWSATTGEVEPWVYQKLSEVFVLDEAMRNRLAELNPKSSARVANRLLEASDRDYWTPDEETLKALRDAGDELEDRVEGILPAGSSAAG